MNFKTISTLSAAFLMTVAVATASQADDTARQHFTCDGKAFSGDYLMKQFPTLAPVTPNELNVNGDFVQSVGPLSKWALVTPKDKHMDCHQFMDAMKNTGIVDQIEPNWIMSIN